MHVLTTFVIILKMSCARAPFQPEWELLPLAKDDVANEGKVGRTQLIK